MAGRDLFSTWVFRSPKTTALFYSFMGELKVMMSSAQPSPTHRFIKKLHDEGRLMRSYTQNIDGLEKRAGLPCSSDPPTPQTGPDIGEDLGLFKFEMDKKRTKNVQLHGDIHRLACTLCKTHFTFAESAVAQFVDGQAPECPTCRGIGQSS